MFDALKQRLEDLQNLQKRALPKAAVAVANAARKDANKSRKAAGKRRKAQRAELKLRGLSGKGIKARVRVAKHKTSGISIEANVVGDSVVLTASNEVQYISTERSDGWMEAFRAAIIAEVSDA